MWYYIEVKTLFLNILIFSFLFRNASFTTSMFSTISESDVSGFYSSNKSVISLFIRFLKTHQFLAQGIKRQLCASYVRMNHCLNLKNCLIFAFNLSMSFIWNKYQNYLPFNIYLFYHWNNFCWSSLFPSNICKPLYIPLISGKV